MNRELDDQVARHVFGWEVEGHVDPVYVLPDGKRVNSWALPSFSSDWRGMQLVVEAMLARGFAIDIEIDSISQACLITHSGTGQEGSASDFCLPGTKLPELVTRAALAALGVPMTEDV